MMKSKTRFQVLSAGSLLLLGACGGDGSSVTRPSAPSGTLTQASASSLAASAKSTGGFGVGVVNSNGATTATSAGGFGGLAYETSLKTARALGLVGREFPSAGYGPSDECEPTKSGTATDADSDEIPVDQTYTFNCSASESGYSYTLSGAFAMQDKDDANKYGGWAYSISDIIWKLDVTSSSGSASLELSTNGSGSSTLASGVYTGAIAQQTDITVSDKSFTSGYYFDMTVTPTDAANPHLAGAINKFEGFWSVKTVSATGEQLTLGVKSVDLTYDNTCSDKYKNGSIVFTDGAGKELKLTYTDCTLATTFDGTAI